VNLPAGFDERRRLGSLFDGASIFAKATTGQAGHATAAFLGNSLPLFVDESRAFPSKFPIAQFRAETQ
jgi:hypothetical protein